MALTADMMVDRRQLRRKLTFWRVIAILAALAALVVAGLAWRGSLGFSRPHIARITIEGMITGRQATLDVLKRADNANVRAVILRINSGGGTTAGSEALYNEVQRLAGKKPVVAVVDGVGASGAYMAALGAERIIANGSGIVGSIGVIAQVPNLSKLLDTLGVKVESVRSSPLKAMPSGVEPTSPEARKALEETVLDTYRWFRALVGERRKLEGEALDRVTDGRVFTGRQAVELKLIDALGGEREAIAWLEAEKKIGADLPVTDYRPRQASGTLPGIAAFLGLDWPGLGDTARDLLGPGALDGLVSIWQPSGQ
ncbi:signal peptide peptidase SppA [Rhabdaerophilum sp. SD176]|uniref:signal peptide peptidase SppA n=1 Tax=Rhabdaerophilum sp. SD176 TaxID=2983548 RepID=UPI0024DFD66D|nr:signal peptide peptidase SppA [Rhabdaerophilum sp. SD176]